jgi:uncharacterized protein YndB with AHSA1/START domain
MTTHTGHETTISADPQLPTIRIVREFDAPRATVFRAWTDPNLVAKWLGPKDVEMAIETWEAHTGGRYRYGAMRNGKRVAGFYGSFHAVRADERIVQTFTYDGVPDGVSLDTVTFEELPADRTRVVVLSVVESLEARDAILASGMAHGVVEGYERLDQLLG